MKSGQTERQISKENVREDESRKKHAKISEFLLFSFYLSRFVSIFNLH